MFGPNKLIELFRRFVSLQELSAEHTLTLTNKHQLHHLAYTKDYAITREIVESLVCVCGKEEEVEYRGW